MCSEIWQGEELKSLDTGLLGIREVFGRPHDTYKKIKYLQKILNKERGKS